MCVYTFFFYDGNNKKKSARDGELERPTHPFSCWLDLVKREEELGKKSEHVYRHRGQEVRDSFFFLPLLPYSSKKRRKEVILHIPVILVRKAWEKIREEENTLTIIII